MVQSKTDKILEVTAEEKVDTEIVSRHKFGDWAGLKGIYIDRLQNLNSNHFGYAYVLYELAIVSMRLKDYTEACKYTGK